MIAPFWNRLVVALVPAVALSVGIAVGGHAVESRPQIVVRDTIRAPLIANYSRPDGTVVVLPSACKVWYIAITHDSTHFQVDCQKGIILQHDSIR